MARSTGVRNPELLREPRRDKPESMTAHAIVAESLRDLRHMTRRAFAPGAVRCVMRMLTDGALQASRICARVASKAERVPGNDKI